MRFSFIEPIKSDSIDREACLLQHGCREFGFENKSSLLLQGRSAPLGCRISLIREAASGADAIFNVSGMLRDEAILSSIDKRVYLDLDPAFIQPLARDAGCGHAFDAHTHFVTIARRSANPICSIPTCGREFGSGLYSRAAGALPVTETIDRDALRRSAMARYGSIHHVRRSLRPESTFAASVHRSSKANGRKVILAMSIHPMSRRI